MSLELLIHPCMLYLDRVWLLEHNNSWCINNKKHWDHQRKSTRRYNQQWSHISLRDLHGIRDIGVRDTEVYQYYVHRKFILREVTLMITIHMKYILLPIYDHKSTIG